MIRINRLLAKVCTHLDSELLMRVTYEDRLTGETTAYLLSFLGQLMSTPNKPMVLRENKYGCKARLSEFTHLRDLVNKLGLSFIEFNATNLTVTYRLYEYYENEYDMYKKLGGAL
jgi:hypothetical protein